MNEITGTIERKGFGAGTWALVTKDGQVYELHGASAELKKAGQTVTISGVIREDIMTLAMIGPVLEVRSFTVFTE